MTEQKNSKHQQGGVHIKDVVYGANDGVITTFAVIAGVAGAHLDSTVVLLIGAANLLADGFSMAVSSYLGSVSERDFVLRERQAEAQELHTEPDGEHTQMLGFLRRKGYAPSDADSLMELLLKNKKLWLDIMTHEELGISPPPAKNRSFRSACATFLSFVGAGSIPLLPYILLRKEADIFEIAIVSTAIALFATGAFRSRFTGKRLFVSGLEMLTIGGIAAAIAYIVGYSVSLLV